MKASTPPLNGISENELKILREWLPKKYYETLGNRLDFHPNHINAVANGRRANSIIMKHLIEMALLNKKEIEQAKETIETLKA